ncbi:hypothetical protein RQP46_005181 [Phenoliferia psychrophenolica]
MLVPRHVPARADPVFDDASVGPLDAVAINHIGAATVTWTGNWTVYDGLSTSDWNNGTAHACTAETTAAACSANISFVGASIAVQGDIVPGRGLYYCALDDQTPWQWYNFNASEAGHGILCSVEGITNSSHTLLFGAVDPTTLRSTNGNANGITLDYYNVTLGPGGNKALWSSQASAAAPAGWTNTTSTSSGTLTAGGGVGGLLGLVACGWVLLQGIF